jgi:membrane protein YdbS with pleckstrin-like domain
MPISPKLLGEGEHVVIETRTHWKALVLPVIALLLTCAATGFVLASLPSGAARTPTRWIVLIVAAASIIWFTVKPFILWLSAEYTITNRRIINRSGILTRVGRDIPLYRINDVSYERGPLDRILGCGTLQISVANEEGTSTLHDVPNVEQIQVQITDLLFGNPDHGRDKDGRDDDGSPFQGPEPDRR